MKNIFITWHYTIHGVAHLKHILSEFYMQVDLPKKIESLNLDQEVLNSVFDTPQNANFLFDEIIYLIAPQEAFDNLSSRRYSYKKMILEDEFIINLGLKELFENIINNDELCYNLEAEFEYVKENFADKIKLFEQVIWRNIHHYPIGEQIKWLKEYSNFKNVYLDRIRVIELDINDLRDEKQISDKLNIWVRAKLFKDKDLIPIVNISHGSTETQVVWHILAEAGQLPKNTRFIKTYNDKKSSLKSRFKPFSIQETPTNLISAIGADFKVYKKTKSPSRELVNNKMATFLKSSFSILLMGERGTGKSEIASRAKKEFDSKSPFLEINCASFEEDSKAEAELFGYEKGAFTGANATKKGMMEEADGGVLFLDEIHHLSKLVQAKLMKALQTDQNNKMSIRRMGSNKEIKVECRLIFATNKSIFELRDEFLPDFYDRIVQQVITIPPIRETREDRLKDWEKVWRGLRFRTDLPKETELIDWIKELPLYGNFRDLQKIAIYYNTYNQFDDATKVLIDEENAFQYAKSEFEKYHNLIVNIPEHQYNFNIDKTTKEMIADYLFELQNWSVEKFGGRKSAIKHFKSKGDTVTEKTFNDWKNSKSVKTKD